MCILAIPRFNKQRIQHAAHSCRHLSRRHGTGVPPWWRYLRRRRKAQVSAFGAGNQPGIKQYHDDLRNDQHPPRPRILAVRSDRLLAEKVQGRLRGRLEGHPSDGRGRFGGAHG